MSVELNQSEFFGNEWECGYSYATSGVSLADAVTRIERAIGVKMTARQLEHFTNGHGIGVLDRESYIQDISTADMWAGIPF